MGTPQKLEFDELINLRLEGDIIWFATILLNKIKEKPSFMPSIKSRAISFKKV